MIERKRDKPKGWIWKGICFKDGWELCTNGKSRWDKGYKKLICKRRDWTTDEQGNCHSTEHISETSDEAEIIG